MFNNPLVLVGTDFSAVSDLALKAGEVLKKKTNGRLHVIHVLDYPATFDWMADSALAGYKDEMIKASHNQLEEQIKRCHIDCTSEILSGHPFKVLDDAIKTQGANILVLGHRGGADDHFHIGGLTTKMVSSAAIPVLVINKPLDVKKVAGLVDPLGPMSNIFSTAQECARLFSAELEFISSWQDISAQPARRSPFESSDHLRYTDEERSIVIEDISEMIKSKLAKDSQASIKVSITEKKKIAEGLVDSMQGVSLGVLNRHTRGFFEKLMIGSVTKRVIDLFRGNLLILPPNEEKS
jgi:nucleotide-binding universal stress UspA family protein